MIRVLPKLLNAEHITESIARALKGEFFIEPEILKINGFATPTMRHLFANLCRADDITYLEIGTYCGATFVAAFSHNPLIHAIGIDDFSQPFLQTGVREQLQANITKWQWMAGKIDFVDGDCWKDPLKDIKHRPIDIFYYDGEHSYESQARALPAFFGKLANQFLYIVDDFHWDDVKRGTEAGLSILRPHMLIENKWMLEGAQPNDDPVWHNGAAIYLCSKI